MLFTNKEPYYNYLSNRPTKCFSCEKEMPHIAHGTKCFSCEKEMPHIAHGTKCLSC